MKNYGTVDLNNTGDDRDLTNIGNIPPKNRRMYILVKHPWDILQDTSHTRSQNKY